MKIFKNIKEYKNITEHYTLQDLIMFLSIILFTYSTSKIINSYISIFYFIIATITLLHLSSYSLNNYYKRNIFDIYFFFRRIFNKKKKLKINNNNMDFLLLDSSYLFGLTLEDRSKLLYRLQNFFENFKYDFKFISYNTLLKYDDEINYLESLKNDENSSILDEKINELKELENIYKTSNLIMYFYDSEEEKKRIEYMIMQYLPIVKLDINKKEEIKEILQNLGIEYV